MNHFLDHFHSLSHAMAYVMMLSFLAYYWKNQIWKAVKGFNGKLQLIELMKLGAIIAMFSHWIEFVFGEKEFSATATLLFLAVAIASSNSKIDLGGIISKWRGGAVVKEEKIIKTSEETKVEQKSPMG